MKKLVLSIIVLSGLLFTFCNNVDKKVNEGTVDAAKYLPLKITGNDYTKNFTYNNQNQVTKITYNDIYEYSFKYSGNQLIEFVQLETDQGSFHKATYTYTQSGTTLTVNYVYEHDGIINSVTDILQVDSKGNLINDGNYTYTYDANDNNIKVKVINENSVANTTYDTKNNIYKNLNLPNWIAKYLLVFNSDLNNPLTFKYVSQLDPEDNNSSTIVYEYNNDSYPIKATVTAINEMGTEVETITIEYIKM